MSFLIWVCYLGAAAYNIAMLRQIDVRRLTFMDGILIGCGYFVVIPMFFVLLHGELPAEGIDATSYRPFEDIATTVVLIGGMLLIPTLRALTVDRSPMPDTTDPRLLRFMVIVFGLSTAYSFVSSGVLHGGHWARGAGEVMETSPSFLLIKHLANFSRTAIFGVIFYAHVSGRLTRRQAAGLGVVIVLADMVMTFNRISGVYYVILLLLLFRKNRLRLIATCIVGTVALTTVSNMWPTFRGLIGVYGYSVAGAVEAAEVAYENSGADLPFVSTMNGVFESSNLVVLNFVVQHSGHDIPYTKGDMFVRPLTFFLPKMIWADRPANFGITLGNAINNDPDLALNSTMFGEPYANFGPFWFVALTVLLLAYHYLFRLIGGGSRAVGFMAAFVAFAMWRFDTVFGVISMTVAYALIMALRWSSPKRSGRRPIPTAPLGPRRVRKV